MNKVYGIIIYLKSDTNKQHPFYGLLYDRLYWAEYPLRNLVITISIQGKALIIILFGVKT